MDILNKKEALEAYLKSLGSVLVAFSGGVDSTFLLKMAIDTLGNQNVEAFIAESPTYPVKEKEEAVTFCETQGISYKVLYTDEMNDEAFVKNDLNRCYYCKSHLYDEAIKYARAKNLKFVVEGSNYDDLSDYRPGRKALGEKGILSPLLEVKLKKDEIRRLSKQLGLKTADKPSFACLASRIPYGVSIDEGILKKIDAAEQFLFESGFSQVRVRYHGDIARIEVTESELELALKYRDKIVSELTKLGFLYITLDLAGYKTGSLNKMIK